MKSFFSKIFDLRSFDGWNTAAYFLNVLVAAIFIVFAPDSLAGTLIVAFMFLAIVIWDTRKLSAAGVPAPHFLMILISPLYFWRRETLAGKHEARLRVAYLLSWFLAIFLGAISAEREDIAATTCEILTEQILKDTDVTCVRAYDMQKQYSGFYVGKAHLSNGVVINVTADGNKEEGMIYVRSLGVSQ